MVDSKSLTLKTIYKQDFMKSAAPELYKSYDEKLKRTNSFFRKRWIQGGLDIKFFIFTSEILIRCYLMHFLNSQPAPKINIHLFCGFFNLSICSLL
jgi:hypothetical protein